MDWRELFDQLRVAVESMEMALDTRDVPLEDALAIRDQRLPSPDEAPLTTCPWCGEEYNVEDIQDEEAAGYTEVWDGADPLTSTVMMHKCGGLVRMISWADDAVEDQLNKLMSKYMDLKTALVEACGWILESFPHPTDRPESLRGWCEAAGIKLERRDILIPREFRGSLRCLTCGEMLSEGEDVVEHMVGHHPGARKLSMAACRENTEWVPEDREKCPRCGIPVPKMPDNVTYAEALCDECAEAEGLIDPPEPHPITILDVARYRGVRTEEDGSATAAAFEEVGLRIFGGCKLCGASLAAYNAYPSKSGWWKCEDCIGDDGWTDVAVADIDLKGGA